MTEFRLAEAIKAAETTQLGLAADSGVSFATINRMCRNRTRQVSLETLDRLATALGVEPGDLVARVRSRK